jgi:hypothetical protein
MVTIQKIGGDNFIIVVCRVSESPSSVAIPESVDARHIGAELIIYVDITALIDSDACLSPPGLRW